MADNSAAVDRLATGRAFHNRVQSAFLTDLTGASSEWDKIRADRVKIPHALPAQKPERASRPRQMSRQSW
jgi:hypothetical protein